MATSSGTETRTEHTPMQCTGTERHSDKPCTFDGIAEIVIDPESDYYEWTCPMCVTSSSGSIRDAMEAGL